MANILVVVCAKCERTEKVDTDEDVTDTLARWVPHGPLDGDGYASALECPRCADELVDARHERISREVIESLGITHPWTLIRGEAPTDFIRVRHGDRAIDVPLELRRTDRAIREELRKKLVVALGLPR